MNNKPSVATRARLAWDFFRYGMRRMPSQSKGNVIAFPAWREGVPQRQMIDLENYVSEGFNANAVIYSAIMYKVRSIGIPQLRAYRGDQDEPERLPPNHPLSKLVARPNPSQSWMEFQGLQDAYLNLSGNAYSMMDRPKRNALPEALHPLNPLRVFIVPGDKGTIKGYWYVPEGRSMHEGTPILPEDVSHVKLPNPADPLDGLGYGLSPISPMARSGDVDNTVTGFIKKFFDSGTMLNTYITYDLPMEEATLARSRDRFQEIYGGADNWVKVGAFDSGGKVERFGMNFQEMGFEVLDARNEARITGPLGVPMILIETRTALTASTYNNKAEARKMFWEDTMTWECKLFEADYQYYLQSDDGGFVAMDYSDVPALQKDRPALVEAAYKLWSMGYPAADATKAMGLDMPGDAPGADISYLPISVIPVGAPAPEAPTSNAGAEEATEDDRDDGPKALPAALLEQAVTELKAARLALRETNGSHSS